MKIRPTMSQVHLAVTVSLVFAVGLIGWHDQTSRRAIMAEMDRRTGDLDHSPLGSRTEYVYKGNRPIEIRKDDYGNPVYKTHVVSVSLREIVEDLNSKTSQHSAKLNDVSEGQMAAIGQFMDESELYLLAQNPTMDVLRALRGQDFDSDGIINEQDDCIDIPGVVEDPDDPYHYNAGGNGCPLAMDIDGDDVADYRDACVETVPSGEKVADSFTMRGPKSLFPKDQGCNLTQVRNRCTESVRADAAGEGRIALYSCPGGHQFLCLWNGTQYYDCNDVN